MSRPLTNAAAGCARCAAAARGDRDLVLLVRVGLAGEELGVAIGACVWTGSIAQPLTPGSALAHSIRASAARERLCLTVMSESRARCKLPSPHSVEAPLTRRPDPRALQREPDTNRSARRCVRPEADTRTGDGFASLHSTCRLLGAVDIPMKACLLGCHSTSGHGLFGCWLAKTRSRSNS
jgi:hypothetical protein